MKRFKYLDAILLVCLLIMVVVGSAIAADGDNRMQAGKSKLTPRFIDNTNGTVTDNLTGLVWLKDADCFGPQTWDNAISRAGDLANGQCGLNDGSKAGQWRLPNREELKSLFNPQQLDKAAWLNLQGFSKVRSNLYWSSTGSDVTTTIAWFADMSRGGVYSGGTSYPYHVWPVRGGE